MPAYAKTPLAQKLGIKTATRFHFVYAPRDFAKELPTLPSDAVPVKRGAREIDLVVLFAADLRTLQQDLPGLIEKLPAAGALWIAWPKFASGVATDLRESVVRETVLPTGLVDNKVCSINDTYSGLRFVRRVKDRK